MHELKAGVKVKLPVTISARARALGTSVAVITETAEETCQDSIERVAPYRAVRQPAGTLPTSARERAMSDFSV